MVKVRETLQFIIAIVRRVLQHDIWGLAAQTAFFLMLAVYPLLMFFVSVVHQTGNEVSSDILHMVLPGEVAGEIVGEIEQDMPPQGHWPLFAVILSTWSASAGVWALMRGIHRAYHQRRMASPIRYRLLSLAFTFGFGLVIAVTMLLLIFGRQLADFISNQLGTEDFAMTAGVRIVVMLGILFAFLSMLYRLTPGVGGRLRQHIPGALFAAILWIISAVVYEVYMNISEPYTNIYGGIGAFLGLMIWLFIICLIVLTGAEINAYQHERRMRKRTTKEKRV